jgi:hypothetical protein
MKDKIYKHLSYGQIRITQTSGGNGNLYGCSVKHHAKIRITICESKWVRNLNMDCHHAGEEIVTVEMSPDQLGLMMCGAGNREGVPCTISHREGARIKPAENISKRALFQEEFKATVKEDTSALAEMEEALEARMEENCPIGIKEQKELFSQIGKTLVELRSNLPLIDSCWQEHMDRTVSEVSSAIQSAQSQIHGPEVNLKLLWDTDSPKLYEGNTKNLEDEDLAVLKKGELKNVED